jgi:hypothetical protein
MIPNIVFVLTSTTIVINGADSSVRESQHNDDVVNVSTFSELGNRSTAHAKDLNWITASNPTSNIKIVDQAVVPVVTAVEQVCQRIVVSCVSAGNADQFDTS